MLQLRGKEFSWEKDFHYVGALHFQIIKKYMKFNSTENQKFPKNSILYLLFNDVNSSNYTVGIASLIKFPV
jgi:hypothetical protein